MSDSSGQHSAASMSPARRTAARAQLIRVVNGEVPLRQRPSRSVMIAAGVVVVGAAASVGAVSLLSHAPVSDPYIVECRATLDPGEQGNQIATATPATIVDGTVQAHERPELTNAVSICAQLRRAGWPNLPTSTMTFDDDTTPIDVSAMTLCVAEDGHAVVVPSDDSDICPQLGLSGGPE